MTSHRLKRMTRGVLAFTAVVAVVSLTPVPAFADPTTAPTNRSEAQQQYDELSTQAEQVNEEWLTAQETLKAKQAELDMANSDAATAVQSGDDARVAEERFRGQVDQLTSASFQGARLNQLSALLTSNSAQNFLDQMSALDVLATDNNDALRKLSTATKQAKDAERKAGEAQTTAKDATDAAAKLAADVAQRKQTLDAQIVQVKAALTRLSAPEKKALGNTGDLSGITVPSGTAGKALRFALDQVGKSYRSGATGPDSYDCSGLTQSAYREAGASIPRTSRDQSNFGTQVSRGDVRAGDLIFFYSPVHHVAMAVDNNRAVHASTEGQPVKVANIDSIGPITVIRRIEN